MCACVLVCMYLCVSVCVCVCVCFVCKCIYLHVRACFYLYGRKWGWTEKRNLWRWEHQLFTFIHKYLNSKRFLKTK